MPDDVLADLEEKLRNIEIVVGLEREGGGEFGTQETEQIRKDFSRGRDALDPKALNISRSGMETVGSIVPFGSMEYYTMLDIQYAGDPMTYAKALTDARNGVPSSELYLKYLQPTGKSGRYTEVAQLIKDRTEAEYKRNNNISSGSELFGSDKRELENQQARVLREYAERLYKEYGGRL